jgi:GAF domain-containing protein
MGKRVLLLFQDGPATQELLQGLQSRGHVASCYSGLRGVAERTVQESPDLVLISLERSDADGRDIARLLRRDARCLGLPLALCAAGDSPAEARLTMLALGAQGVVRPDVDPQGLLSDVEDLLLRRKPHVPAQEAARLAKLHSLDILDSPPDAALDAIVAAASEMVGVPIALVSLVDAERQWFKSRVGLEARETPRELAFCAHAIHGHEIFEVSDSRQDERFAKNPLVTGAPNVVFYAGAPLMTSDGHAIGTLCVIDQQPRQLNDSQRRALVHLGRAVTLLLERGSAHKQSQHQRPIALPSTVPTPGPQAGGGNVALPQ